MSPDRPQPYDSDLDPTTVHIPTVQHGLFTVRSLMRQAQEGTDLALTNLQERDLTLAAAALECAEHYSTASRKTLDYIGEEIEPRIHEDQAVVHIAQTGQDLDNRIDEIRTSINSAVGPAYLNADRVYKHACHYHYILNLSELRTISHTLHQGPTQDPDWSENLRSAHIIQAETLAYRDAPFDQDGLIEPEDIPPEDVSAEESLTNQAAEARETMQHLVEPMLKGYDESLPADVSPTIAAVPDLAKTLRDTITPPAGALIGFHITGPWIRKQMGFPDRSREDQENEPDVTIIHISIVHNGRKVIKRLEEPYPKGYPAKLAAVHASIANQMLDEAIKSKLDNPLACEDQTLENMIGTLEQAIRTNMHDVTGSQIKHVLETAAKHGCPPAAQASMLSAATLGDRRLANALAGDQTGAWRRTARQEQAQAVIDAGRNAGLDNYALDDLAWTMGFHGADLGVPIPKPTTEQLNAVITATEEAGLPQGPRQRMINTIQNSHPHRARS